MRPLIPAAVAASLILVFPLAACETGVPTDPASAPSAARQCFNVRVLSGFESVDRDTLRVRAGGDRYDLDLSGPGCDRIEWSQRVAIESAPSSSYVCVGHGLGQGLIAFRVPETRQVVECRIDAVRPVVTPARD